MKKIAQLLNSFNLSFSMPLMKNNFVKSFIISISHIKFTMFLNSCDIIKTTYNLKWREHYYFLFTLMFKLTFMYSSVCFFYCTNVYNSNNFFCCIYLVRLKNFYNVNNYSLRSFLSVF